MKVPDNWRSRTTVTVPEAAAILGVSEATLRRAIDDDVFPVVQLVPRGRITVSVAELERRLRFELPDK